MPVQAEIFRLELEVDTEVDPRLLPISQIKFQVGTDSIREPIGCTQDESTRTKAIRSRNSHNLTVRICIIPPSIKTSTKSHTSIDFPFGNHHVQTISSPNSKINIIIRSPIANPCTIDPMYVTTLTPHVANIATNRERTFPYPGQRIIIGHIGTHNPRQTQSHTQDRGFWSKTVINTASLSRLNHGHTANCNGRNQCDNHFFHVVVFFV